MRNKYISFYALAIFTFCINVKASDNDFKITLGGQLTSFNSAIQINNSNNGNNRQIDLENDLGYDNSVNLFHGSIETTFSDNHRLYINISPFRRKAQSALLKSIDFEDDTLLIDTDIDTKFVNTTYDLIYGYRFKTSEKGELEALAGIYWMKSKFDIEASGLIENELGEINFNANYKNKRNVNIPLPLFGLGYKYHLTNEWELIGSARYFSASYNDLDGSATSFSVSLEYDTKKEWGYGLSLVYLDVDVGLTKSDFKGRVNWQYSGLTAYLFYKF
ncbi:MAG: hypothetical protein ACI9IA_000932 [Enterobacterales bacterium]|jgi:hypothetical protein